MAEAILNVLADRYATPEMKAIWSTKGKIIREREFWVLILRLQNARSDSFNVPDDVIADYEAAIEHIDLDSIRERELASGHDVDARIKEFNHVAGHDVIHQDMTSRDLTDNTEQRQILGSMQLTRERLATVLVLLAEKAQEYSELAMVARSHNVAAQATTFGKRLASIGVELLWSLERLDHLIEYYPLRGIVGPVGTQASQLRLMDGDIEDVESFNNSVQEILGFNQTLISVGQVYPRVLDFDVISTLMSIACGPSDAATTFRLMAGYQLLNEAGTERVGSSAMPHKINARTCERIVAFKKLLAGHVTSAAANAGEQWQEGDVSDSLVRRAILQDAFFCIDGQLQAFMHVLLEMAVFPEMIKRELNQFLPFVQTTELLSLGVRNGLGNREAHQIVGTHAKGLMMSILNGETDKNDLFERLAADPSYPADLEEIQALSAAPMELTGMARHQVEQFCLEVEDLAREYPEAAKYRPEKIL